MNNKNICKGSYAINKRFSYKQAKTKEGDDVRNGEGCELKITNVTSDDLCDDSHAKYRKSLKYGRSDNPP